MRHDLDALLIAYKFKASLAEQYFEDGEYSEAAKNHKLAHDILVKISELSK